MVPSSAPLPHPLPSRGEGIFVVSASQGQHAERPQAHHDEQRHQTQRQRREQHHRDELSKCVAHRESPRVKLVLTRRTALAEPL